MRCAHGFWVFRDCLDCVGNAAIEKFKASKKAEEEAMKAVKMWAVVDGDGDIVQVFPTRRNWIGPRSWRVIRVMISEVKRRKMAR